MLFRRLPSIYPNRGIDTGILRNMGSVKCTAPEVRRIEPPICPSCKEPTKLVPGNALYPERPDLERKRYWACFGCDAYVGCHPKNSIPLGTVARKPLRASRSRVLSAFDPLWKSGRMTRPEAYEWLAKSMGISMSKCRVAMFDERDCEVAIEKIRELSMHLKCERRGPRK